METSHHLDDNQFAYKENSGTEDAICTLIHTILQHADKNSNHYARCLFLDISSAFNTIQPHVLLEVLENMTVNPKLLLLIYSFMTDRPQYVRTIAGPTKSISISTGTPQGCVLSPVLFSLYTNPMKSSTENVHFLKYADDTVIVGLIKGHLPTAENNYRAEVAKCTSWCDKNFLVLNKSKTKELIINFGKNGNFDQMEIEKEKVEVVQRYKYLGVHFDAKLKFDIHAQEVHKKTKKTFLPDQTPQTEWNKQSAGQNGLQIICGTAVALRICSH